MNAQAQRAEPVIGELNDSTHLLGNRAALDAVWERDGYWFFRNVLDLDAVERCRTVFLVELERLGVIESGDRDAIYNGASLEKFPVRMDPLAARQPYRQFIAEAAIDTFFKQLLQDDLFWVPFIEYRATPPSQDRNQRQFDQIHEDGNFNCGIPFRICWVPLSEIDAQVGGVALAEGLHRGPSLHKVVHSVYPEVEVDAVPAGRWRRATYRPGDLLMMHPHTPHSGVINRSNRFRMSVDLRVCAASDNIPIVGEIAAISADEVMVRNEKEQRSAKIADGTYARDLDGRSISPGELASTFRIGTEVILATKNGAAVLLRPIH